ncbi:MAG TPA: ATP-binding protein [bacterium]|nr:ATP-binding protein [bacterium]HOL93058.1 ATP-binding protein [bacterium]HPP02876.1 ATP-binding protein [bacterium]
MKSLRTRLIFAFLGVAVLAMISLSLVPYWTLQYRNKTVRDYVLQSTLEELQAEINQYSNAPAGEVLLPLAQYLEERIVERPGLLELLEETENLTDPVVQNQLSLWEMTLWRRVPEPWKQVLTLQNFKLIPRRPYLRMKEWLEDNLLYEENGRIYTYAIQEVYTGKRRREMQLVGALILRTLLIAKDPNDPNRRPLLNIRKQYSTYLTVLNPQLSLLEPYLPRHQVERLAGLSPQNRFEAVDVDRVEIAADDARWPPWFRKSPLQMKLLPVVNHERQLAAIMVLALPITSIIGTIGYSLLAGHIVTLVVIVLTAVLFARSISQPVRELATAAERMAEGDFGARVIETGSEELRILSTSFNQMAVRIQNQLAQLRQKTAELEVSNREVRQTQRFLENILANIRTGVLSVERNGRISHVNQACVNILRITGWEGKDLREVVRSPALANLIHYSLEQAHPVQENEILYELADGTLIPLQISTAPVLENGQLTELVVTVHDLSAIRQLEERVRRQDRLAALGHMAAGVAHEIRNPLGIIRGSAELLKKRFAHQPEEAGLSDFILEEVARLSRVVNDFLLFARPPAPHLDEVRAEELFTEIADYFEKQPAREKYPLVMEPADGVPALAMDLKLGRQIFLNLFLNAQEAMPEGGTITVRARAYSPREVAVEVIDEGMGIPPDRIDKIFDPFFTMKENGTGLGLSLVYQLMSSHGGRVEVESTPGQGSVFRLIFPAYEALMAERQPEAMV